MDKIHRSCLTCILTSMLLGTVSVSSVSSAEIETSGDFDWHATIAKRPVFAVDYWPGVPGVVQEGRADISSDLEHIKSYADPVLLRPFVFDLAWSEAQREKPMPGSFEVPDLLGADPAQLRKWQDQAQRTMEPLLAQYRSAGVKVVAMGSLFCSIGQCHVPDWYTTAVPDWEECDLSGRPLSKTAGIEPMACLVHPKLYDVIDRYFSGLSFLQDTGILLGTCIDNEPFLGRHDLSNFGGNVHSVRAFRSFLREHFDGIDAWNRIAGTAYASLNDVGIADDHWLVRVMAGRFRATLVCREYMGRAPQLAQRNLPGAVTISRVIASRQIYPEQNRKRETNGMDLTYLRDAPLDVLGMTVHFGVRPDHYSLLGDFQLTGSLFRGSGKILGITEPLARNRHLWGEVSTLRAREMEHVIYRGLYYNLRFFTLHSWGRTGPAAIYNEPFGLVHSQRAGLLSAVRRLRDELDAIAPFQTFGEPVSPPLRILVSRNARHFPGMGGQLYGNWLADLAPMFEDVRFSCYEVVEEQTFDVAAVLATCRGVVVADACLEPRTRDLLDNFVRKGGKLLVFGAPAYVGPTYLPDTLPNTYPVGAIASADLHALDRESDSDVTACTTTGAHPIWTSVSPLMLQRPTRLDVKSGAVVLALDGGNPVAAANDRVVYLGGIPANAAQRNRLLENFARWCGVEEPAMLLGRFENATVAQNYNADIRKDDATVIDADPWYGSIPLSGAEAAHIRELREDHPWLAYHVKDGETVIEGVRLDSLQIKVFRREDAPPLTHFEGLPDTVGFRQFWHGEIHPVIGRFSVAERTSVSARLVVVDHEPDDYGWFVTEIDGPRIAEGLGNDVVFEVMPGREYYLVAVKRDHPHFSKCPLCLKGAFE